MFERLKQGLESFIENVSKVELSPENLTPILEEFKISLLEANVAIYTAEHICMEIMEQLKGLKVKRFEKKDEIVRRKMRNIILETLSIGHEVKLDSLIRKKKSDGEVYIILFLGINGTGKTTSMAKLAYLLNRRGFSVVLACSDTYRAGAIEQIMEHAKRLGVRAIKHMYGSDPAAVAYDSVNYARARGLDVVLIDTAGRMQTNRNLMDELKKIVRVIEPDFKMLVVDALTGNDAVNQAEEFDSNIGVDGMILTKVDADIKGGTALSVIHAIKKPILFIGTGQEYEDLEEFNPEAFTYKILGL